MLISNIVDFLVAKVEKLEKSKFQPTKCKTILFVESLQFFNVIFPVLPGNITDPNL
jgi:hypothetical protein